MTPKPMSPRHDLNTVPATAQRWPFTSRLFHWVSVIWLVAIWAMIALHENTADADKFYISMHKALGVCFFFWIVARFINRMMVKAPTDLPMPAWQRTAAHLVHSLLYGILLLMPLSGFLMTQYSGRGVNLFGIIDIPNIMMADKQASGFFHNLHTDIFWPTLLLLTVAHILGVIKHVMAKQPIVRRML